MRYPMLGIFLVSVLMTPTIASAETTIPQEVIDQCNAANDQSEMPDCLKNGSLGYEMLELARTGAFYGPAADPVIKICNDSNDLYSESYVCFKNASDKASETRGMIGLENIQDRCVAAISDPNTYAKLETTYQDKLNETFPDEMFLGGTMYHPFTGCPVSDESGPSEDKNANESGVTGADDQGPDLKLSGAQCAALKDFESKMGGMSLEELKVGFDKIKTAEEGDLSILQDAFGVSPQTTELIKIQSPDENQKMAFAGLSLVAVAHPELIETLMEVGKYQGSAADSLAQMMILGMANKIASGYQVICK